MEKSQTFSRLVCKMKSAVWKNKNEINPKFNKDLANVLEECAANNMRSETIKRTLDRLSNLPPAQTFVFDICGRSGISVLVEIETSAKGKTTSELRRICNKFSDFGFVDNGSHAGFQEIGSVKVFKDSSAARAATTDASGENAQQVKVAPPLTLNDAETLGIELECEEVRELEADADQGLAAMFEFTCPPDNVDRVSSMLRVRGYVIQSADVEFFPYPAPIKVTPQLEDGVKKLYEKLEEIEGVGRIFDNVDWGDSD